MDGCVSVWNKCENCTEKAPNIQTNNADRISSSKLSYQDDCKRENKNIHCTIRNKMQINVTDKKTTLQDDPIRSNELHRLNVFSFLLSPILLHILTFILF